MVLYYTDYQRRGVFIMEDYLEVVLKEQLLLYNLN